MIIEKVMIFLGFWSKTEIGVLWDCPDCGCHQEFEEEPEYLYCGSCLQEYEKDLS